MATNPMTRLTCDRCGCTIADEWDAPAAARECMAKFGWKHTPDGDGHDEEDVCPDCSFAAGDLDAARVSAERIAVGRLCGRKVRARAAATAGWIDGYISGRGTLFLGDSEYRPEAFSDILFRSAW